MQDIRRQLHVAARWLPLIVIGALLGGGIAYAYANGQPKVYEATARLIVDPGPGPTIGDFAAAGSFLEVYARQATSRGTARAVARTLEGEVDAASLGERIEASTSPDELMLEITVGDADPQAASAIALAVGQEVRSWAANQAVTGDVRDANRAIRLTERNIAVLQRRLNNLRSRNNKTPEVWLEIADLSGQISGLRADILRLEENSSTSVRNRLNWLERPSPPERPSEPRPAFWALIGLFTGGMAGASFGFTWEFLNGKVRDRYDMEAFTGVPTLGVVAEGVGDIKKGDRHRLVMLSDPRASPAEMYRQLRVRIGVAGPDARTLLVTSLDGSDARSVVAANLALAYAEAGRNVVLVDADRPNPRIHGFFGLRNERGFTSVVANAEAQLPFVTMPTNHPRLRVMSTGLPGPGSVDLSLAPQLGRLISRLSEAADMVIFHGPSVATSVDTAVLAAHVDASVLVAPKGARGDDVAEASEVLHSAHDGLVGGVLYRTIRGSHHSSTMPSRALVPYVHGHPAAAETPPPKQARVEWVFGAFFARRIRSWHDPDRGVPASEPRHDRSATSPRELAALPISGDGGQRSDGGSRETSSEAIPAYGPGVWPATIAAPGQMGTGTSDPPRTDARAAATRPAAPSIEHLDVPRDPWTQR